MKLDLDDRHQTALIYALGCLKGLAHKSDFKMTAGLEDCIIDILDSLGVTHYTRETEDGEVRLC